MSIMPLLPFLLSSLAAGLLAFFAYHKKRQPVFLDSKYRAQATTFKKAQELIHASKTDRDKKEPLQKPWFLLLGSKQAGKHSLLDHAELDYSPHPELINTQICDWWFCRQQILLDWQSKTPEHWQNFLQLLRKNRTKQTIDAVLIVFDLQQLLECEENATLYQPIQSKLQDLHHQTGCDVPIYVIFTKVDRIAGFVEYFGDLSTEERQAPWGFDFSSLDLPLDFKSQCQKGLQFLTEQLQERLIWRLHQEHDLNKRRLIKDFPLQFENIHEDITQLLHHAFNDFVLSNPKQIQGVFFTSARQYAGCVDPLSKTMSHSFALHPHHESPHHTLARGYFSHALFNRVTDQYARKPSQANKISRFGKKQFIIVSSLLIFSSIILMQLAQHFQDNLQRLNQAQQALNQPLTKIATPLGQLTQSLHRLSIANKILNTKQHAPWDIPLKNLQQSVSQRYQNLIQTSLLPQIKTLLESKLAMTHNPQILYSYLRLYLMLKHPQHAKASAFDTWLTLQSPVLAHQKLGTELVNAIRAQNHPITLNNSLIINTRAQLKKLGLSKLAYVMLGSTLERVPLILQSTHPLFRLPYEQLPYLYTVQGFQAVTPSLLKQVAHQALRGNWVIGTQTDRVVNSLDETILAKQVQGFYEHDYATLWQTMWQKTRLRVPQDLDSTATLLQTLPDKKNAISRMLVLLDRQLTPIRIGLVKYSKQTKASVDWSLQLQILHVFVENNWYKNNINELKTFTHLGFSLHKLLQHPQAHNNIYTWTTKRFQHAANHDPLSKAMRDVKLLPTPLNHWLNNVIHNTWKDMVQISYDVINQRWQHSILPFYQQHLAGLYPFKRSAFAQVSLENFQHFFAHKALFDQFYKNNLAAYIHTSKKSWSLRKQDGVQLPIKPKALLQIQLGHYLTEMFYPKQAKTLAIPFILKPLALEPIVKKFTLEINGQTLNFTHKKNTAQKLSWPGQHPSHQVKFHFETLNGRVAHATAIGPWAWFKVLDKAHIASTHSPLGFHLTFDLNGNAAKYLLVAQSALNPFIPHVMTQFKLPEKL